MNMLHQNVAGRVTMERQCSCTHLVENHSQRIEIAAIRACKALRNLWRDVGHVIEWESKRILHGKQPETGEFRLSW